MAGNLKSSIKYLMITMKKEYCHLFYYHLWISTPNAQRNIFGVLTGCTAADYSTGTAAATTTTTTTTVACKCIHTPPPFLSVYDMNYGVLVFLNGRKYT